MVKSDYDSEHQIMAEMLYITSVVDDVIEEYNLKIPSLNVNTIDIFEKAIKRIPNQLSIFQHLSDAVKAYANLNRLFYVN